MPPRPVFSVPCIAVRRSIFAVVVVSLVCTGAALAATLVAPGTISTIAGSGTEGRSGDGGPASVAALGHPRGLAVLSDGAYLVAQPFDNVVRRVASDGTISTVAGTGAAGSGGDGGQATLAELRLPHGVAVVPSGVLVADMLNDSIRMVRPDGAIVTVAGIGRMGYSGDGGLATAAAIAAPRGVAGLPDGGFLIPDTGNERIRRVWPNGTITTVTGTGTQGDAGDGGPAVAAQLDRPFGAASLPDGGFLIAEAGGDRVRRVWPDGVIRTVAGVGTAGFSGDGGPARAAQLDSPHAIATLPNGGFLIADASNNRVRRVWPDGTITTVAGTGVAGFAGDGGPAAAAELSLPKALAVLPDGSAFLVGDAANNRVRLVAFPTAAAPRIVSSTFGSLRRPDRKPLDVARVRVCDGSRSRLTASVVERGLGGAAKERATWSLGLASTSGGCRGYVIPLRQLGSGAYAVRVWIRNLAGSKSNVVAGSFKRRR